MGRSVGGRVGGGGHHHSSTSHHYHHSSPRRYHSPSRHYGGGGGRWSWGYGGGWRVRGNPCVLCAIPIFFILLIICIVVILVVGSTDSVDTYLTRGEQAIVCPDSISSDGIKFTTTSSLATAYLFYHEPSTQSSCRTSLDVDSKTVRYNYYTAESFNLVPGSSVDYEFTSDGSVYFYIIKGSDEMKNFENGDDFYYEKFYSYSSGYSSGIFTAKSPGEYYFVIKAHYYSVYISSHSYVIDHTAYSLTSYSDKSSSDYTFDITDHDLPGACVVVDMPCSVSDNAKAHVTLDYSPDHSGLFWACVALAAVFGVCGLAFIAICVICVIKKRKGQQGTTYANVPDSSAAAPSYPAGYQQPQVPVAYNTADPAYATAGAPPPAMNPAYAPGAAPAPAYAPDPAYAPNYGTVQATY